MIKMLRIDDNLLHGQVAFSWVRNMKIHTIVIADDKVVHDQFMKMTLGLSKPAGVNLMILSIQEAIEFLKSQINSNLNVLGIVNSLGSAKKITQALPEIRHVNIGLLRRKESHAYQYEMLFLTKSDARICDELISQGIELEYRLRYEDQKVLIKDILNEKE